MRDTKLEIALDDIRSQADFEAALYTDLEGVPLAVAQGKETPPETVDVLTEVAERIADSDMLREQQTGESEFFDWEGRRVVCRWFKTNPNGILVVLVPKNKSYKWAMGRMVREIQRLTEA